MLSIESMTITAYISDGSVLCRACGEKAKLPASDSQCDYTMQSDFYEGISCDECGKTIVEYPEEEEDIDPIMQAYSNPKRASDPYSLPDVEVFQLTADEAVQQDEDLMWEASKKFPLMHMNSRDRDKAIAWAVEESGCTGGWYWWSCFPGCLPDSSAMGPFDTRELALADAREGIEDEDEDN